MKAKSSGFRLNVMNIWFISYCCCLVRLSLYNLTKLQVLIYLHNYLVGLVNSFVVLQDEELIFNLRWMPKIKYGTHQLLINLFLIAV